MEIIFKCHSFEVKYDIEEFIKDIRTISETAVDVLMLYANQLGL